MKIKTYVISLKKAEDRRRHLLKETADFNFMDVEWVEAVNGKELSQTDTERLFNRRLFACRYNRLPYPGEVGCTLSHHECYRRLLESNIDVALILEDDVFFLDHDNVENILTGGAGLLKEKGKGVMTLSDHRVSSARGKPFVAGYSLCRVWFAFGTNAYLIHKDSAKKLFMDVPASILADDYQYMNMKGIPVYGLFPYLSTGLSTNGNFDSEIVGKAQAGVPGKDILFKYKLNRFIRGGIRRALIFLGIMTVKNN